MRPGVGAGSGHSGTRRRASTGRSVVRGQVLVIVVLGLFALFAATALGIDGSRLFEERRAAQAAVDHAATTAAFSRCTGSTETSAVGDGIAAAARNGYNNDGVTNSVAVSSLGGNQFRASIDATVGATFGRVVGFTNFRVSVEATADCTGGGPGNVGAIWAGGDNCTKNGNGKYQLDVSGSNQQVYGGVHSNGDVNIGTAPNWWTDWTVADPAPPADPFTYVGEMWPNSAPAGNVFEAPPLYPQDVNVAPSPPWPAGYAPDQAAARLAELGLEQLATANGTRFTSKVTTISKDGVIWTDSVDGMDISSVATGVNTVTLVATSGPIKISVSNRTFHAHTGGILMVSNLQSYSGDEKCDKFTVAISGQASHWDGLIWAPGGLIEFSGSNTSSVNGTLLGWSVRLNGSNITIVNNPALFATPPSVVLVK